METRALFGGVIYSVVPLCGRSSRDRLVSILGCGMFLCSCKRDEASGVSAVHWRGRKVFFRKHVIEIGLHFGAAFRPGQISLYEQIPLLFMSCILWPRSFPGRV